MEALSAPLEQSDGIIPYHLAWVLSSFLMDTICKEGSNLAPRESDTARCLSCTWFFFSSYIVTFSNLFYLVILYSVDLA